MKFAIIILWAFLIACLMRNAHSSESVIANEKLSQSATDKEKEKLCIGFKKKIVAEKDFERKSKSVKDLLELNKKYKNKFMMFKTRY